MKKIIGLSIAAVAIIAIVVGGTFAYFSDTETVTVNTMTAGTIDLEVSGGGDLVYNAEVTDMKPCETGYLVITLTNVGENDMDIWKLIEVEETTDGVSIYPPSTPVASSEPEYEECGGAAAGYVEKNDIDKYIHFDMWIEDTTDTGDFTGDTYFNSGADTMIIDESDGYLISDGDDNFTYALPVAAQPNGVAGYYIYIGSLASGESMVIVQSFHLDGNVTNWAQGDTMTLIETLFAQQTVGNPPAPSPELPD